MNQLKQQQKQQPDQTQQLQQQVAPVVQNDRPFQCNDAPTGCKKAFARRSDLVRHQRIHSNDRPFKCTWENCKRDFIQRSALTVHIRVHTGERPHKCEHPECSKAFSDSSSLARHRRIHTGKRPYKCLVSTCQKTFCRKTTLTKHNKKHHKHLSQVEEFDGNTSNEEMNLDNSNRFVEYEGSYDSTSPSTPSDSRFIDRSPDPSYYGTSNNSNIPTSNTRRTSYKSNQPRKVWNPSSHQIIKTEGDYLQAPEVYSRNLSREPSNDGSEYYEEYSTHSASPYPQEYQQQDLSNQNPTFVLQNPHNYNSEFPNFTTSNQFAQPQSGSTLLQFSQASEFGSTPSISQYRQYQQQQHQLQYQYYQQQLELEQQQQQQQQQLQFDYQYSQSQYNNPNPSPFKTEAVEYQFYNAPEPISPSPYQFRRASSTSALELPSGLVGAFNSDYIPRRYSMETRELVNSNNNSHEPNLLSVEEEQEYSFGESVPMTFGDSGGYFSSVDKSSRRNSLAANSFANLANNLNHSDYRGSISGSTAGFSSYISQHIEGMSDGYMNHN